MKIRLERIKGSMPGETRQDQLTYAPVSDRAPLTRRVLICSAWILFQLLLIAAIIGITWAMWIPYLYPIKK